MSKNDTMEYNFNLLKERVLDTLNLTTKENKIKEHAHLYHTTRVANVVIKGKYANS